MISDSILEQFGPLSKLIVNEVIAQLKQDGLVLSTPAGTAALAPDPEEELMNLASTAELLDHSYFWLSRNYRRLGLKPSRIGGKLLFQKADIFELVNRQKIRSPGRPRLQRLGEL